jgi:hypothetical protein
MRQEFSVIAAIRPAIDWKENISAARGHKAMSLAFMALMELKKNRRLQK